jgi:hypothetical protein
MNQNEQQWTDKSVINLVESSCSHHLEDYYMVEKVNRMSCSGGLKNINTVLAFFGQERDLTAVYILLFRSWHDFDTKERKAHWKQLPVTLFFKQ